MQSAQVFIRTYHACVMDWVSRVQNWEAMGWGVGVTMKKQGHRKEEEISNMLQDYLTLCIASVSSRNTKIKLYITSDFSSWSDVSLIISNFVSKNCFKKKKKEQAIPFYVGYTKMSFPKNLICYPRAHKKMVSFYLSIIIFHYFPAWLSTPTMLVSWGFFYEYHFLFETLYSGFFVFCFFFISTFKHSSERS